MSGIGSAGPWPAILETWQPATGWLYRVPAQNQRWNSSTV